MSVPKSEPLIFPKGVRFPRKNELPKGSEDALRRIAAANITTGYVRNDDGSAAFSSYFEANVHANKVFWVFVRLAISLLPDVAAPIIGLQDEEPVFGPYTSRDSAIEVFEPHTELLQHDGFLEFGITFQHKGRVEEIFVKSSKYFRIWTNQPEVVAEVLEDSAIPRVAKLEFIDEYPMVSKSINRNGNAAWPGVYHDIKDAFENLPPPNVERA